MREHPTALYRPLMDPLFIVCTVAYAANRMFLKPHLGQNIPFLRDHFNDLLFFPVAFPLLISIQQLAGVRDSRDLPSARECIAYCVLWSILFEIVFPSWLRLGTADVVDAFFYAAGMVLYLVFFRIHLQNRGASSRTQ